MPTISIQQLLMAGAHFGHLTRRWNPKMEKYIFDSKHGIHIIDLKKTQTCIDRAIAALQDIVKRGEKVLFIGTKKQAKDIIRSEANRIGMPFVCERWLGGMLTNFSTIRKSLKTLQTLERTATDGTYEKLSKKERLSIEKEKAKLEKALGGIRELKKLPGAVYVVDIRKEHIAIAEARKLSIPIVAIVDTNTDPDIIDYPVPGNDDAFKSIGLITRAISDAVEEAAVVAAERRVAEVAVTTGVKEAEKPRPPGRRRRPRRRPPRERFEVAHAGEEKPEPAGEVRDEARKAAPEPVPAQVASPEQSTELEVQAEAKESTLKQTEAQPGNDKEPTKAKAKGKGREPEPEAKAEVEAASKPEKAQPEADRS
jgi:small subunit ribosomal protein S2